MDWKALAARLAEIGLPILAKIVGGELRRIPILGSLVTPEHVESVMRKALALALGTEATPEAIGVAIENAPTSEVMSKLQSIESSAAEKYPALADIARVETQGEVDIARVNAESFRALQAAEVARNDFWPSFYRTILNWGATFFLLGFGGLFVYAIVLDAALLSRIISATELVQWLIGGLAMILGAHFYTRGKEREAAMTGAPSAGPVAGVVKAAITKR